MVNKRKITAVMVLMSLIGSQIIDYYVKNVWTNYFVVVAIIIAGVIMFIQSGNDSDWIIEKTIIKKWRRR